jgi:glycerol-3-phosphate dehydrogenase subunit C
VLDLFALVPGLDAIDLDHDCCGVAGTYGLKKEKYDIAMAVGEPLFRKIRETAAPRAVCDSETCRWQIELATSTPVKHPVEILAEAYAAAGRSGAAIPISTRSNEPAPRR